MLNALELACLGLAERGLVARQSTQSCSNCCSIDGPTERLLSVFFEPSSHRSVSHTSSLLVQVSLFIHSGAGMKKMGVMALAIYIEHNRLLGSNNTGL